MRDVYQQLLKAKARLRKFREDSTNDRWSPRLLGGAALKHAGISASYVGPCGGVHHFRCKDSGRIFELDAVLDEFALCVGLRPNPENREELLKAANAARDWDREDVKAHQRKNGFWALNDD